MIIRTNHLPDELEQIGIRELTENETAYAQPWAIWVDEGGLLRINGNYPFTKLPRGTSSMRIRRDNGKILVDMSSIKKERFKKTAVPFHIGCCLEDYLPVEFVSNFDD